MKSLFGRSAPAGFLHCQPFKANTAFAAFAVWLAVASGHVQTMLKLTCCASDCDFRNFTPLDDSNQREKHQQHNQQQQKRSANDDIRVWHMSQIWGGHMLRLSQSKFWLYCYGLDNFLCCCALKESTFNLSWALCAVDPNGCGTNEIG